MKGNKKILVAALLLLLISVSFGTYAIYKSNATATGTLTPAKWSVKLGANDFQSATYTFTDADIHWTTNPAKAAGTIAPGATGTISIPVDADGSQVDVVLTAALGSVSLPSGWHVALASGASEQTISYSTTEGEMEATVDIEVSWDGTLEDDASKDTTDRGLGASPVAVTIPVTLTARQSLS